MAQSTPSEHDTPTTELSNGISVPLVGLGCASGVREHHVSTALSVGYRYLDTAQSYAWGYHEDEVGTALRNAVSTTNNNQSRRNRNTADAPSLQRKHVFLQTKIHPEDLGYEATKRAVNLSLERLRTSYIDSVLIHKPRCWDGACRKKPDGTWQESWTALEELYQQGIVRAIGICDVDENLLTQLLSRTVRPHIIQNWMDPLHQDVRMRTKIQSAGILYQAYSTLGTQWVHHRGVPSNPILTNPTLSALARKHGVDVAQIVLRWATNHGVSVLPASTDVGRQRSNLVDTFRFDLDTHEMRLIDALDGTDPSSSSSSGSRAVKIEFENLLDGRVEAFWIKEEGGGTTGKDGGDEEVYVGSMDGGGTLSLNTHDGHVFVFRDAGSGMAVGDHVVDRKDGTVQMHGIGEMEEL